MHQQEQETQFFPSVEILYFLPRSFYLALRSGCLAEFRQKVTSLIKSEIILIVNRNGLAYWWNLA